MSRTPIFICLLATCIWATAASAEDLSIPLAVPWKAKLIHPLPPAPSDDKSYEDHGISDEAKAAVTVDAADQDWDQHLLPGPWESYGGAWQTADGEAVFRLTFDLPATLAGHDLELSLGAIDDFDDTFFNGIAVGHVDKKVLGYWTVQRVYRIPALLAKAGKTVIAVRVFDHFGGGGFTGPKEQLVLRLAASPQLGSNAPK